MLRFFSKFDASLLRHPLIINMSIAGGMTFTADIISQLVIERAHGKPFDFYRLARMTAFGYFYYGPIMHMWFSHGFINKLAQGFSYVFPITKKFVATKFGMLFTGVWINQAMFSFIINPIFLTMNEKLVGTPMGSQFWQNVYRKSVDMALTNLQLWPFANFLTFWLIPVRFQVLFVNTIAFFWRIYICYLANRHVKIKVPEEYEGF